MTREGRKEAHDWVGLLLWSVVTYFLLQTTVVIAHEYAHSTAAWLLRLTPSPFTVVWGNPLTILGWDEGVPYDRLFPVRGNPAEAVIGGVPLLMHAVFAGASLGVLFWTETRMRRWLFLAAYWFAIVNLTELVAYVVMRPFAGSGDTGRFNEGLNASPWGLFLGGLGLLGVAFYVMLRRVMPCVDEVLEGSRSKHRVVVGMTAFLMFLWGSGLRVMALYPDRQWRWGVSGIVGFVLWIVAGRWDGRRALRPASRREAA